MLDEQFLEKSKINSLRNDKEVPYVRNGYSNQNNNPIAIQDQDYEDRVVNQQKY